MSNPINNDRDILDRLERLEREGRRWRAHALVWRIVALASFILMAVVALPRIGFTQNRKITAEEFVLADGRGRERAALRILPNGDAALQLLHEGGTVGAQLDVGVAGSQISINDGSGKLRVALFTIRSGEPQMNFLDERLRIIRKLP